MIKILKSFKGSLVRILCHFKSSNKINFFGLECIYDTSSKIAKQWFYPRYFNGKVHEPAVARLIVENLKNGDVFFDVGANLGFFTILAAKKCFAQNRIGDVHAFELDPALIPVIQQSVSKNRDLAKIHINCMAISGGEGIVGFTPHIPGNPSSNMLFKAEETDAEVQVASISLDDYIAKIGKVPQMIKIDIEGAERFAIEGMNKIFSHYRPKIIMELHPKQIKEFGGDAVDLVNKIISHSYEVIVVEDYRGVGETKQYQAENLKSENPVVLYLKPLPREQNK